MTQPDASAQFAQFQAFQAYLAQTAGGQAAPIGAYAPERVLPEFRDVLSSLVTHAKLASENIERDYIDGIVKYLDRVEERLTALETKVTPPAPEPVPAPVVQALSA